MYQILQQANKSTGQTSSFSAQEPISGITPCLAALDATQALRQKEWQRGEPGEDMPQQYSSISGHLTPTSSRHEDMRLDLTLNVTPERSLGDLPAAVGGMEEDRERIQQVPEKRLQGDPSTDVKTSKEVSAETLLKVAPEGNVRKFPRRIQQTREASRKDAMASTRQFFALVNERNRGTMMEGPIETSPDASGRNANDVPVTSTPVTPTTPIVTEAETTEGETTSPRTFLPNGSPSRPTATATCRPRTLVQHISEGQINEPTQEDTNLQKVV